MHSSAQCGNIRSYAERDLSFHLLLCEKSGNRFLLDHLRKLIVPFFGFCVLRHTIEDQLRGCADHRRILQAVRSGDPDFAHKGMETMIRCFSEESVGLTSRQTASRTARGNPFTDRLDASC